MTIRADRMVQSAAPNYQFARVYKGIQQAIADEYDRLDDKQKDLEKQFNPLTATWGLKYWEEIFHIPTVEADGYEIRRSRVVSAWRGIGNFSAELIKSLCEAFTNGEVIVTMVGSVVNIVFSGVRGVPPNIEDLQNSVDNIIHAHLEAKYIFTYLTWAEFDTLTVALQESKTWDELEVYKP